MVPLKATTTITKNRIKKTFARSVAKVKALHIKI